MRKIDLKEMKPDVLDDVFVASRGWHDKARFLDEINKTDNYRLNRLGYIQHLYVNMNAFENGHLLRMGTQGGIRVTAALISKDVK